MRKHKWRETEMQDDDEDSGMEVLGMVAAALSAAVFVLIVVALC